MPYTVRVQSKGEGFLSPERILLYSVSINNKIHTSIMKKTLVALFACAVTAQAGTDPTPVALWNGFDSLTDSTGSLTLAISGSTVVNDSVLSVVGSNPTSAKIDLSGKGYTFDDGFSVAMWVTDFAYGATPNTPVAMFAIGASGNVNYAAAGLGLANAKDDKGAFAYSGSAGNVNNLDRAIASCLHDSTPDLVVATFNANVFTLYVNGNVVVNGTAKDFDGTKELAFLSLGSWNASSAGFANEKIHSLALFNTALTAQQARTISIPEPATATLSLLALAGLAARRKRH